MADLTIIQDIYDLPTPTRITTWGPPEKKSDPGVPGHGGWKDPFGPTPIEIQEEAERKLALINPRRGVGGNCSRKPFNARKVIIMYPDGTKMDRPSVRSCKGEVPFSMKKIQALLKDGGEYKGVSMWYKEEK